MLCEGAPLLNLLITIFLSAHLLCMNVCSAGPLLCIWLNRKQATADSKAVGLDLAWHCLWLLAIGIVLGLLLGTTSWAFGDRDLLDALPLFRSKVLWGIAEIGCSFGWLWGYWAWLKWRPPTSTLTRILHASLPILSATNLLYHFPPLMTLLSQAANGDLVISEPLDSAAYRALVFTPHVMAHALHIWLASFAVSGVFLFWLTRNLTAPEPFYLLGSRVALVATLAQIGSGVWLLLATPADKQSQLLGSDLWTTGLLVVSILAAFQLLQQLAAMAFGDTEKKLARHCGWLMIATVTLMTAVLCRVHG